MQLAILYVLTVGLVFISNAHANEEQESGLSEFFKRSEHTDSDEQWVDLTASVMMEEPNVSSESEGLHKRDGKLSARKTSEIIVEKDPTTGTLLLPRNWDEVKRSISSTSQSFRHHVKRGARHVARSMSVVITWYTGHDLLNPSCVRQSSWAPTDSSMVGAVTIQWSNKPACGRFVRIRHHENKGKSIVVRIMDSCAGCASGSAHIDLTTGAFKKLYNLDVGLVSGLQAQMVNAPEGYTWSKADINKYGPQKL
ncbi:hypothetical protein CROQUDRAFT_69275 [Cronartium quercuum f. sp. fusiforme G11]|uniref:RlpA-like protein double-psi beta-barrel domain-containing protein n=1 Tax=Cronartium quercuum f. sp. fusiforme G11 TaxID=708437 RepID=A0A9P6N6L4_9BASI|nr:hypothetical protein CROQUDRAFT_69275 [Cronartium quercuum f. sp. fusiforme G11]